MDIPRARSALRDTLSAVEMEQLVTAHVRSPDVRRQAMVVARDWAAGPGYHPQDVDVLFHDGDLEIGGDFHTGIEPWTQMLVVHGDLAVSGLLEDCLDPESLIVVTGDLRAGNLITEGWLEVQGNVTIDGCVLFEDNDCSARIVGNLTAGLIFTKYHHVEVGGQVTAPLIAGDYRRIESPHNFSFVEETDPSLVPLLVPEVLSIEGDASGEFDEDWSLDYVDSRAMADLIRAGKSPLRAGAPSHTALGSASPLQVPQKR
ncbi:hypothetical protein OG936_36710 [Streptomyces sp. NBC_00846]|uniref:hypothetical protein n=1 Tax=Streptomyces sp. NBC_00846 TaxID=2975849 RepID=UPI00386863CD|nr:hypothetical protein OG936_36710 [Streptomyces sp. NBC_00846]